MCLHEYCQFSFDLTKAEKQFFCKRIKFNLNGRMESTLNFPESSEPIPNTSTKDVFRVTELRKKLLQSKLDAFLKSKPSDTTRINITIRAVHVHDTHSNKKTIQQLRYLIFFLIAIVIMALLFGMIFLNSLSRHI